MEQGTPAQIVITIFLWKFLLLWTQVDIHKMIYKCLMMIIQGSNIFKLGFLKKGLQ